MRRGLGQIFMKLIPTLAHHVQEKHATLRGIDQIFEGWRKDPEGRRELSVRSLAYWHSLPSPLTSWLTPSPPLQRHGNVTGNSATEVDDLHSQPVTEGPQSTVPEFVDLLGNPR